MMLENIERRLHAPPDGISAGYDALLHHLIGNTRMAAEIPAAVAIGYPTPFLAYSFSALRLHDMAVDASKLATSLPDGGQSQHRALALRNNLVKLAQYATECKHDIVLDPIGGSLLGATLRTRLATRDVRGHEVAMFDADLPEIDRIFAGPVLDYIPTPAGTAEDAIVKIHTQHGKMAFAIPSYGDLSAIREAVGTNMPVVLTHDRLHWTAIECGEEPFKLARVMIAGKPSHLALGVTFALDDVNGRVVDGVGEAARERGTVTTGRVYGVSPDFVYQEAGRGVIRQHDRTYLENVPHTGDLVCISYHNDLGIVEDLDKHHPVRDMERV